MKYLSICLLIVLLPSCTMIPSYTRPSLPVAADWNTLSSSTDATEDRAAITCLSWQNFFCASGMEKIIYAALHFNRDIRIAALTIESTKAQFRIEKANMYPWIDGQFGLNRQKVTRSETIDETSNQEYISSTYTANVAVTAFELDLFGRLRSQSTAALETYFSTQAAYNAVKIRLIAEVANTYLQWLADCAVLALTEKTLAAQENSYDLIKQRVEKGIATKLDLAQVSVAVETAKTNRALYTRLVMQDKNALLLLTGLKEGDCLFAMQSLNDVQLPVTLPRNLPSEILFQRPDVQEAEYALKAANADIGAARAAFFPRISLTGQYGFASSELSHLFAGSAAGAWGYASQITTPIFHAGRNIANLKLSEVRKNIYVAEYEKAIQNAFKEVANELAARQTLDNELNAQKRLVEATQDAYTLSYARYKQGVDNFLNVLDAQRSLFTAQQREIEIEKQRIANIVNLYKALGGDASRVCL